MDRNALINDMSERLSVIQSSVSPDVWQLILLLEERLIAYHQETLESSYNRGYLQGLLEGKGIKTGSTGIPSSGADTLCSES